jgi:hypothetical protein
MNDFSALKILWENQKLVNSFHFCLDIQIISKYLTRTTLKANTGWIIDMSEGVHNMHTWGRRALLRA